MKTTQRTAGFSLIEVVIAVAIIGILAALAVPSMKSWSRNERLLASAREIDGVLAFARSEAIRTGDIHLVFFQVDAFGNTLTGPKGNTVQLLVVNDGRPGEANQNCQVDAGEAVYGLNLQGDVTWGVTGATGPVATDPGAASITAGTTFEDAGGNAAQWIGFRSEGIPLAFSSDCSVGGVGTGGGGLYIGNGKRDKAVVMTPLGSTRVHSWNPAAAAWSS